MATKKSPVTQFDFSGGELPPVKHGRTDDPLYSKSVEEAYNMIPRIEGPVFNRPGTERLFTANTRIGSTRLIPLDPILGQGVLLEFSDDSIRILQPPPYGVPADPGTISGPGTGFEEVVSSKTVTVSGAGSGSSFNEANGVYNYYNTVGNDEWYRLYISPTLYYELNYQLVNSDVFVSPYDQINQVDLSTGSAVTDSVYFYGYNQFGLVYDGWFSSNFSLYGNPPTSVVRSVVVETVAGFLDVYKEQEIADIRYTFSGDTIYLTHDQHPPAILYKDASDIWQYEVITFTNGPYNPPSSDDSDIQLTLEDFQFRVSLYIKGVDFSSYSPGDYISYKYNGEYVLSVFESLDGTETDRAIVKPVKSVVTDLSPAARIEAQPTGATFSYIGAAGVPVVSTDKSVFSSELEGSWLRFVDIASTGKGTSVTWVQLETYLGTDVAGSGFYFHGGVNPAEVDVFSYDASPGALVIVTDFTEYERVDGVSVTPFTDAVGTINDTYVESSRDLFNLVVDAGETSGVDLGRQIQVVLEDTVLSGYIVADGSSSPTKARVVFDSAMPYTGGDRMANGGVAETWRLGAYYTGNYPSAVAIFSQRLILGGTPSHEETVWSSEIDQYFSFSPVNSNNETLANTAFSVTLGGTRLSRIRWIYSGAQLLVGMEGSLWMVSSTEGVYSAQTAHPRKQSEIGSILPPVQVGVILLLVHASGRQIHQLRYDDQAKSYDIDDGSVIPNHLFQQIGQEVVDILIQNAPNPIVWVTRADGLLCSVIPSWSGQKTLYGLSQHGIGSKVIPVEDTLVDELGVGVVDELGSLIGADSYLVSLVEGSGSVVATAALYDALSGREQLYVISNWGLLRFVDRLSFNYDPDTAQDRTEMLFLDSATVRSDTTPKTVWTEFSDYAGETVTVVADGVLVAKNTTFTGPDYTLSEAASQVIIGYSYSSRIHSLPATLTQVAGNNGTQGRVLRHTGVLARIKNTLNLEHGSDLDELIPENFENNDDILNGTDLFTGDARLAFHADRGRRTQYYIQQSDPYPLQILSVTAETEHE
jgi:hypothetical protein